MRIDTQKAAAEYRLCQWTKTLQEQKSSGLSISAWCEQTGVPRWQYFYWQRRIRAAALSVMAGSALATRPVDGMMPAFVEITPAIHPPTQEHPADGSIRIQLNGAEIDISGAASPAAIETVLRVLRESSGGKCR